MWNGEAEPQARRACERCVASRRRGGPVNDAGPLLEVEGVSVRFGALMALHKVSLRVERGGILAIIGPHGAGQTTLLNVISGFYHPRAGRIRLAGRGRT